MQGAKPNVNVRSMTKNFEYKYLLTTAQDHLKKKKYKYIPCNSWDILTLKIISPYFSAIHI